MGVGEQLDLHGVEPNALPTTARILLARVKVRIILGARERREQSHSDRQGYDKRRCAVDGEWRAPVDVVEARVESFANIGNRHSHISRKFVTPFSPFHANSRVSCSRNQLKILKCCRTISCNATTVRLCISVNADILCARVYDWGAGFDLEALTAHDFADLDEHGRGIFLIRAVMDSVEYCRTTDGNVLEMRKNVA